MRSDSKAFVGVDIGTSSLAAVVTDWRGRVLKTLSAPNPSALAVTALNTTIAGIYAHLSALKGGETLKIPSLI